MNISDLKRAGKIIELNEKRKNMTSKYKTPVIVSVILISGISLSIFITKTKNKNKNTTSK